MSGEWVDVGPADAVEPEDVIRADVGDRTFAVYRTDDNRYFATDGLCTHGQAHLAEGYLEGTVIECPKHNGRFDICTGKAKGTPVSEDVATCQVRIASGRIELFVEN